MSDELKPCPFCGGEPVLKQYRADGLEIKCQSCHSGRQQRWLHKGRDWLAAKMVEKWNTRAQPSDGALTCCTPSAEEKALLAAGDYTAEELWGGSRPTCPKCIDCALTNEGAEPVACYVATDDLAAIDDGSKKWATAWASDGEMNHSRRPSEPLYRQPKASVVLPSRADFEEYLVGRDGELWVYETRSGRDYDNDANRDFALWNACLDRIKELNP